MRSKTSKPRNQVCFWMYYVLKKTRLHTTRFCRADLWFEADLWLSVRLRWRLISRSTSRRKFSRFSSKPLALLKHHLHVLHVLRRALAELIEALLVFLFGLKHKTNCIFNPLTCCIRDASFMQMWKDEPIITEYLHKVIKVQFWPSSWAKKTKMVMLN